MKTEKANRNIKKREKDFREIDKFRKEMDAPALKRGNKICKYPGCEKTFFAENYSSESYCGACKSKVNSIGANMVNIYQ